VNSATGKSSPVSLVIPRLGDASVAYDHVVSSRTYSPPWHGQLASSFGDTLHYIAVVVLVFQLTGQALAAAGMVVLVLVLGPIAGVIIDRVSRKSVLIGADLFRVILALSLLWPQGAWYAYLVAAGQYLLQPDRAGRHPSAQYRLKCLRGEEQQPTFDDSNFCVSVSRTAWNASHEQQRHRVD
jgi:hypothetical protein